MQQSSALILLLSVELIESQGAHSLKKFLDRTESENSTFISPSTNTGGGKAHRSLLNEPKIKEVRTLLNTLRIDHPKLTCLIEILKEKMSHHISAVIQTDGNARTNNNIVEGNHFEKAIIFTQYRDTAQHIVDILNSNSIKASRFVGQAKKEDDVGMKQEEQAQVLEFFRRGEFLVFVTTSITEEGLDIPKVDLVIFYEPIPSEIRKIQRRGRTGRKNLRFCNYTLKNQRHYR